MAPAPHVNDAATRLAHRHAGIDAIRRTDEYITVIYLLISQLPQEPDPHAPLSKREWEAAVTAWRNQLRDLARAVDLCV